MSDPGELPEAPAVEEKPDAVADATPEGEEAGDTPAEGAEPVEAKPNEPDGEAAKPKPITKGVQARINELTRQREEQRQGRERAEAERDLYRSMAGNQEPPKPAAGDGMVKPTQGADFQAMVQAEAIKMVAKREQEARNASFFEKGRAEFPDFNDRCKLLDDMGANDSPAFVEMVTSLDNGPQVIASLADDPEEAARIMKLPLIAMTRELVKRESQMLIKPIKTISAAPAPAKPIAGNVKPNGVPSDDDTDKAWFAKRQKEIEAKFGSRR